MSVVPLLKTKVCKLCSKSLPLSYFTVNNKAKDKLQRACKECDNERQRVRRVAKKEDIQKYSKEYRSKKKDDHGWRLQQLLNSAKARAVKKDREFNLTLQDLNELYPKDNKCPVFGFELTWNQEGFRETSPSIDRIDSTKGYTKDNVQIISWKANRIKGYASVEDLEILLSYLKQGD